MKNRHLLAAFFFSVSLLLLPLSAATTASRQRAYSKAELELITRLTARILASNHYRSLPLSATLSQQLFDAYLKRLDPGHMFFLAGEVDAWALRYRDRLGDDLKRGDSSFGMEVYRLYRERNREFRAFAEKMLAQPMDFTVNEELETDRSKSPWPASREAQHELWRKRVKNDLLTIRLLERSIAEEEAEAKAKAKSEKKKVKKDPAAESEGKWEKKTPEAKLVTRLRDIANTIEEREPIAILGLYLDTLAQVYGPHSSYMPPREETDFDIRMSLSLTGIGATLTSDDGLIKVVALVPNGPADRQGELKVNDRIIRVTQENGETTDLVDMPVSKAVQYIRGPVDSKVTLTVIPGIKGRNAPPVRITITRAKVELVDSAASGKVREVKRGDGSTRRIGIITLPSFYLDVEALRSGSASVRRCSDDVEKILTDFRQQKVDAVVIDLRRNGGGSLPEAIRLSGLFFPVGPVVQIRSGRGRTQVESDEDEGCAYAGPVVILTSKLAASASEIFCAALRDRHRAVVVGDTRTFGKGTILNVVELSDAMGLLDRKFPAGSISFESAMFFRISGGSPQQLGIAADIVLPSLSEELEVGEMFLDRHLPWDTVAPVKFDDCDPNFDARVARLRRASAERIEADPRFKRIRRRAELMRRHRGRKTISLNEATRYQEYLLDKAFDEANRIFDDEEEKEKEKKNDDPILDEAVAIAADCASPEK